MSDTKRTVEYFFDVGSPTAYLAWTQLPQIAAETGATASVRGSAGFAAFAGAKHALRALAQSMARELGPQGVHVAHVVIDGAIDTRFIAENFPERYALKELSLIHI